MKKLLYIFIISAGCKDVYNPPLKNSNISYLVVEGNIIAGNDSTIVHLSRTTAINDTSGINKPETDAIINVESENGDSYKLKNEFNGVYDAPPLNISQNKNYRLHIFTNDGKEYASDYVPVKITPPIDSISWKYDSNGVNIYVSAHDDAGKTLYYQWNFTETWQHSPVYTSGLIYDNGTIRFRKPDEFIKNCWTVIPSSSVYIASTTQLSSDVLYEKQLVHIPSANEKLSIVYSILVKQNALTKAAYEFWQNLRKNTEQIGTIFDPQPFAEFGNVHCISKPGETVLGFISANSIQQQRIYIWNSDLPSWGYKRKLCALDTIPPASFSLVADGSHTPLYYVSVSGSPVPAFAVTANECADCRLQGGTTIKPPYMP